MTKTTKHCSEKTKIITDFVVKVNTADRHQTLSHIRTRQEECGVEQAPQALRSNSQATPEL